MRYFAALFAFFVACFLLGSVMHLRNVYKQGSVNARANDIVEAYAKNKANSAEAKYRVTQCGQQVTPGGIRRRMYDVTFIVGETTVVRRACVTIEHRGGEEKLVQFSSWPTVGGPIEVHELRAKL